jgi:hypothetical protein
LFIAIEAVKPRSCVADAETLSVLVAIGKAHSVVFDPEVESTVLSGCFDVQDAIMCNVLKAVFDGVFGQRLQEQRWHCGGEKVCRHSDGDLQTVTEPMPLDTQVAVQ